MKKIIRYMKLFFAMLVFGLLSACGANSLTPKEVIEKNEAAMDAIDGVELTLNSEGTLNWIQVNTQEKTAYHTTEDSQLEMTYNEDVLMTKVTNDLVIQESKDRHEKVLQDIKFIISPFYYLEIFDEEIVDKFIVKDENKDEITIAYNTEEYPKEASELSEKIILLVAYSLEKIATEQTPANMGYKFKPLELELTIDKTDYLLSKFNVQVSPVDESLDEIMAIDLVMTYDDYNKDFDIVMFEETERLLTEEEQGTAEYSDMTVEEGAAYLEALIQATVYQNAAGFIELAPESMGADRIESDSVLLRDTFKSVYIQNSKQSWEDIGMPIAQEQHEALADAFLNALAKTDYEIVEQKKVNDEVLVTLSIQGVNETEIIIQSNVEMMALVEEEGLSPDEALEKLFELLIDAYNNLEDLEEPVLVDVVISKTHEDFIVNQDQYLTNGFVH